MERVLKVGYMYSKDTLVIKEHAIGLNIEFTMLCTRCFNTSVMGKEDLKNYENGKCRHCVKRIYSSDEEIEINKNFKKWDKNRVLFTEKYKINYNTLSRILDRHERNVANRKKYKKYYGDLIDIARIGYEQRMMREENNEISR